MIGVPSKLKTQTLNKGQGCTGKLSTEFSAIFPVDRAIEASMIGRNTYVAALRANTEQKLRFVQVNLLLDFKKSAAQKMYAFRRSWADKTQSANHLVIIFRVYAPRPISHLYEVIQPTLQGSTSRLQRRRSKFLREYPEMGDCPA